MTINEKTNKELKSIISQFKDSYRIACDSSRNEYIKTLSAGARVPKEGILYGDERRQEFESMCAGYRDKALALLNKVLSDLHDKMTEAPSTDAVNSITLLGLRKHISQSEIENLLERYGDNPQAWNTIVSIARDHDIHAFNDHPIKRQIEAVDGLARTMERTISAQSANGGHASDGFLYNVKGCDFSSPRAGNPCNVCHRERGNRAIGDSYRLRWGHDERNSYTRRCDAKVSKRHSIQVKRS